MRKIIIKRLYWIYIVTGIIVIIIAIYSSKIIQNDINYSYVDLESSNSKFKTIAKPAYESFVEIDLDSTSFKEIVNNIKNKEILLVNGWGHQINESHFFVRGFRNFEKPFFSSLLSRFKFWYVVFEIEYESKRVYIKYDWFDGDSLTPVTIQNKSPKPNEATKLKGQEINTQISNLIINHQN